MSDDDHPQLSEIEMLNGMRSLARLARALYEEMCEQGFSDGDALMLASAYLLGAAGGKLS